jgi:hypothetical protein
VLFGKLIELAEAGKGFRVEAYAAEATPPTPSTRRSSSTAHAVGEAIRRR